MASLFVSDRVEHACLAVVIGDAEVVIFQGPRFSGLDYRRSLEEILKSYAEREL